MLSRLFFIMPKIRQTNRVMKVGNQWLPAFLNTINGTPTYTYMNDQGQWADASGNTYSVEHPLDEVTVKYDPETNGQINKAAPDYWRQYGQRKMQKTAGDIDKVIMGTIGVATAPLWLPYVSRAGLELGAKRIGLEYAVGQGAERFGDFVMKRTTGMGSNQASHKLLSPLVEPLDITDGQKEGLYRLGSQYVNPGSWFIPSKHLVNGYIIDDIYNFVRFPYDWFTNQK